MLQLFPVVEVSRPDPDRKRRTETLSLADGETSHDKSTAVIVVADWTEGRDVALSAPGQKVSSLEQQQQQGPKKPPQM